MAGGRQAMEMTFEGAERLSAVESVCATLRRELDALSVHPPRTDQNS
jgi:hypothetical protein